MSKKSVNENISLRDFSNENKSKYLTISTGNVHADFNLS